MKLNCFHYNRRGGKQIKLFNLKVSWKKHSIIIVSKNKKNRRGFLNPQKRNV